jgi:hypothetical protein
MSLALLTTLDPAANLGLPVVYHQPPSMCSRSGAHLFLSTSFISFLLLLGISQYTQCTRNFPSLNSSQTLAQVLGELFDKSSVECIRSMWSNDGRHDLLREGCEIGFGRWFRGNDSFQSFSS